MATALAVELAPRPPARPIYLTQKVCPVCHEWAQVLWCRARGVWLHPPRCPRCLRQWTAQVYIMSRSPSEIGRALQALRRTRKGRPKVFRPCRYCGQMLSARDLREHKCPEKGNRSE
jgi:hypothetical protein